MKIHSLRPLLAALILVAFAGCGGNPDVDETSEVAVPPTAAAPTEVRVFVVDGSSAPLEGVQATVVAGSATATTADDGSGRFELPAPAKVIVKFSKAGFSDVFRPVSFAPGSTATLVRVALRPRDAGQAFDATAGGSLVGRDGASVSMAADALVDAATGAAVSGMVDIAMTSIDVSGDELRAFPGRFMSTDTAGELRMIASYGTTEFILTQGGRRLNLAPGRTATIELPIYTPFHSPGVPVVVGDTIPLLSLDETTGDWKQEGVGTVVASAGSPTGLAMRGTVGHFSWWNCDDFVDTGKLNLDIETPEVPDADRVPDDRPMGPTDDIETDPNRYRIGAARLVHIDAKTADDRLLRQQGIDFEAAFSDDPFDKRGRLPKGAGYAGPRGLVIPAARGVAVTACAQVQRGLVTRFQPTMACGTVHVLAAKDATVRARIPLVLDFVTNFPTITRQPVSTTVELGAAATFSVTAARISGGGLTYQWTRNGVPIGGATAAGYATPPSTAADANSLYAVIVTAPAGVTVSLPARLILAAPPPPPPPPPNAGTDRWVDAALGNDVNAGTEAAPLRTITAALAAVQSGGTVWLADGTWTPAIDIGLDQFHSGLNCNVSSPRVTGTTLRAVNPGRVTIRFESASAVCVGDTQIRGVRFESTGGQSAAVSAAVPGSSLLSGVSFVRGYVAVRNGGRLTIEPGGLPSYGGLGDANGRAITVYGAGSEVVINGGVFDSLSAISRSDGAGPGCPGAGNLYAFNGARLVLNQVDLKSGAPREAGVVQQVAVAGCSGAVIELNGTTISGFVQGPAGASRVGYAVSAVDSTVVLGSGTVLSLNRGGLFLAGSSASLAAGVQITSSLGDGIYVYGDGGATTLTMNAGGSVQGSGGHGIEVAGSHATPPVIDISGATLANNAGAGVHLRDKAQCRIRDSVLTGNLGFGVFLEHAGANCDLGTAASRGGNTLVNAGPNVSLQASSTLPTTVPAVGNTWTASQQGSDTQGRYAVPAGQALLEVGGPVTTGVNYRLNAYGRIRLAE